MPGIMRLALLLAAAISLVPAAATADAVRGSTSPQVVTGAVDDASLSSVYRIAAGRLELRSLQNTSAPDQKRIAHVHKALGDLLSEVEDGSVFDYHAQAIEHYKQARRYRTRVLDPKGWADLSNDIAAELRSRTTGNSRLNARQAVREERKALQVYKREKYPKDWAMAQSNLCVFLREAGDGARGSAVEAAITACRLALTVQTRADAPREFLDTSENLAFAIAERQRGSGRENLDAEISAFEGALEVLRDLHDPAHLARTRRRVGILYGRRSRDFGVRIDLDRAILTLEAALSIEPGLGRVDRATALQELGHDYEARLTGDRAEDLEQALRCYRSALELRARSDDPEAWTSLQIDVGSALEARVRGDRAENIEESIAAYRAALSGTSSRNDPANWASIQNDLGVVFDDRIKGDRRANLRAAVAAYSQALRVGRRVQSPGDISDYLHNLGVSLDNLGANDPGSIDRAIRVYGQALAARRPGSLAWGETQNNLGEAYLQRKGGSVAANMEAAIQHLSAALQARSQDVDPGGWAQTLDNLATAYTLRVKGDRAQNFEVAIKAYRESLMVRTQEAAPRDWAATENNLGQALVARTRGDHGENVDRAIQAYQSALTEVTEQADPLSWALIEDNLGNAYLALDRGSRTDNVRLGLEALDAALRVRTFENAPMLWAETMNDRAIASGERTGVDRAAGLVAAIHDHERTLRVWSKRSTPVDWAMTMHNLGAEYSDRRDGDRSSNIETAIKYYKQALQVRTRAGFPFDWAITAYNLGEAYRNRLSGEHVSNLDEAISEYTQVLTVQTRKSNPIEFIKTQKSLAQAYLARPRGDRRENQRLANVAFSVAMDTVDNLLGDGLAPRQTTNVMNVAGELFRSAALQAGREGRLTDALEIAERGRARVLQLALQLDEDARTLPPADRERLEALRAELGNVSAQADREISDGKVLDRDAVAVSRRQQDLRLRAEVLRSNISALLPKRDDHPMVMPVPPEGGAIAVPIIARDGGLLLLLTGKGLTSVDLPGLDDARMRQMYYGPSKIPGQAGWSRAYDAVRAQGRSAFDSAEWKGAVEAFEDEAWRLFADPLVRTLDAEGVGPGARLVLVTQDFLARMPIWLARDGGSGRLLADLYDVTSVPNLETLRVTTRSASRGPAAYFNSAATPNLPLTALARRLVERQGVSTIGENDAGDPSSLLAQLQDHREWFFWTHGRFDTDDPRRSSLQLARDERDGTVRELTVGELLDARFGSRGPELVVLSACESGLADVSANDELIGLPTVLLQAGARGVISAMWPVPEDATVLLMAKFSELAHRGDLNPSQALRLAAQWLRSTDAGSLSRYVDNLKGQPNPGSELAKAFELLISGLEEVDETKVPFADPYFWAAFSFTGTE